MESFHPTTNEEFLAFEIAQGLQDEHNLGLYLAYAQRYPEHLLREIFDQVKQVPPQQIKKSRGALFTYLVQRSTEKQSRAP